MTDPIVTEPIAPATTWTSYGAISLACGVTLECQQLKGHKIWRSILRETEEVSSDSRREANRRLAEKLRRAADELEAS